MTYEEWFLNQAKLHKTIMNKLEGKSIDETIEYFKYDNMKKNEPDFCPLYNLNKKCHEMDDLNCYLCACSYFRFNDKGLKNVDDKILYSCCSIDSKSGSKFVSENSIHHDCSNCIIPHKEKFIKKNFNKDWLEIMKDVRVDKNNQVDIKKSLDDEINKRVKEYKNDNTKTSPFGTGLVKIREKLVSKL